MIGKLVALATFTTASVICVSFAEPARETLPQLMLVQDSVIEAWAHLRPGGAWHPASFIEHRGHLVLEGVLCAVITYLLLQGSFKPRRKAEEPLTDREIQDLCDEWQPEPLHGSLSSFQRAWLDSEPILESAPARWVSLAGRPEPVLDLVSLNFLGLADHPQILEAARSTIHKYGVGSCGPRGFYGTLDVHLALEERLARFMGSQEAILYSYDLATMPSILPAFANRKDLIVMDEGCGWPIRNGAMLSRARVLTFRHNDVKDLEKVLGNIFKEDASRRRPLNRRFIVVEGVYTGTGEVAPLAAIAELKNRYKYRLVVDESLSLGVLGSGGRGASQEAGLDASDVEIIGASLGNALATVGGFCAGDREIVDHQRLSGTGYCFSASLPPYLASAASAALDILEKEGSIRARKVRMLARRFRASATEAVPGLRVVGEIESAESPLVHMRLDPLPKQSDWDAGDLALLRVAQDCLQSENIMVTASKYSGLEGMFRPPPSLRISLSACLEESDVDRAVTALANSCKRVLGNCVF